MIDHIDDIESDLSAIHRIDDMWSMEAGRFFRYATRLPAYRGVMRMVAEREVRDRERRKEAQGLAGKEIVPVPAGELNKIDALGDLVAEGLIEIG